MQIPRSILFVDGENLVKRYQKMVDEGRQPLAEVVHEKDCFVWHRCLTEFAQFDFLRVCYYTSVAGDDDRVVQVKQRIAKTIFHCNPGGDHYQAQLVPFVFKKPAQTQKTRSVDINIVVDVMNYACSGAVDLIFLASGDGDYLPLITEVMKKGKQVNLAAFSSGLNPVLPYSVDEFFNLDEMFFAPKSS